jgi:8-oxo-dGTP diphosphatase
VKRLHDVDWARWSPAVRATLLFVVRDGRILLIRKKRGLGAGKINGPGGKLDPGEAPLAGAIREVEEEIGVTPTRVEQRGEIRFQFTDGLSLLGLVFLARDCEGELRETDEAAPFWTPVERIPWSEMWADDVHWMPSLLAGRKFSGRALFDGDALLDQRFEELPDDHVFAG